MKITENNTYYSIKIGEGYIKDIVINHNATREEFESGSLGTPFIREMTCTTRSTQARVWHDICIENDCATYESDSFKEIVTTLDELSIPYKVIKKTVSTTVEEVDEMCEPPNEDDTTEDHTEQIVKILYETDKAFDFAKHVTELIKKNNGRTFHNKLQGGK